jgi:hypothetical protein
VVGATVLSHFVLDAVVHVAGLPLAGGTSYRLGLGLWRHTGLELAAECGLAGFGWWLYRGARNPAWGARRWALATALTAAALLTIWGALTTAPPPPPAVMAASSLLTLGLLTLLGCWLDRGPRAS